MSVRERKFLILAFVSILSGWGIAFKGPQTQWEDVGEGVLEIPFQPEESLSSLSHQASASCHLPCLSLKNESLVSD